MRNERASRTKDETKIKLEKSFNNGICQIRRSSCTRKFELPNEWPCQFTQNECNSLVKYLPTILVRIRVMSFVCSTTAFIPDRYYRAETIFFYMVTKFGLWLLCAWEIFSDRFCGKKFQIIAEKYVPFRINQQRCSQSITFGRNLSIARLSFHDPSETARNGNSNLLWRRYRRREYSE